MSSKVVIVGNSPQTKDNSKFINGCDRVFRFSQCMGLGRHNGTKTTDWVMRTYCPYTDLLLSRHKQVMKKVLGKVSNIYIVYGFYDSKLEKCQTGDRRVILKPNTVPYDDRVISLLGNKDTDKTITPVIAGDVNFFHPTLYPTSGFIFLSWMISTQVFSDSKVFLAGFDLQGPEIRQDTHSPKWERTIVQQWLQHEYIYEVE